MSVSLALLPVALALRIVMGKENFEKWVDSMQIKIPTSFKTGEDLCLTVKKADYDVIPFGNSFKTHIQGEEYFFFWDLIDGKWTAIFSKGIPAEILKGFMNDLTKKAGREIFLREKETGKVAIIPTRTFPTNFTDGNLLFKTLDDFGCKPTLDQKRNVTVLMNKTKFVFRPVASGAFIVEVTGDFTPDQAHTVLSEMDETYKRNVQSQTYENLVEKIQERHWEIEEENVLEDNSIVITVKIGD